MKAHRGFTLLEMLIAIAIVAVLAALALPSFSTMISTQRLKTASYDLQTALWLAKSEAVKRRGGVEVQRVGTWAGGWRVVNGGTTLREAGPLNGIQVTPSVDSVPVIFRRDGRLETGASPASMGSNATSVWWRLSVPEKPSVAGRCVSVDLSGMISVRVDADGDISNGC